MLEAIPKDVAAFGVVFKWSPTQSSVPNLPHLSRINLLLSLWLILNITMIDSWLPSLLHEICGSTTYPCMNLCKDYRYFEWDDRQYMRAFDWDTLITKDFGDNSPSPNIGVSHDIHFSNHNRCIAWGLQTPYCHCGWGGVVGKCACVDQVGYTT